MANSDGEPTAVHPLWLDWFRAFIAAKGRPADTLELGRQAASRRFVSESARGGGIHPFPKARDDLQTSLREVGELWATDRLRAWIQLPGASEPAILSADPDDRRRARFSTTQNTVRLPDRRSGRLVAYGPIRIEDVTTALPFPWPQWADVVIDELEWLARRKELVAGVGRQAEMLGSWFARIGWQPPGKDRIEDVIGSRYRELGGQRQQPGPRRAK